MTEKEMEKKLKALANHRRLGVIKHLRKTPKASVGEIARAIKLSFKSTSRHLAVLFTAEIVQKDQQNLAVFYSLVIPMNPLLKQILMYL